MFIIEFIKENSSVFYIILATFSLALFSWGFMVIIDLGIISRHNEVGVDSTDEECRDIRMEE